MTRATTSYLAKLVNRFSETSSPKFCQSIRKEDLIERRNVQTGTQAGLSFVCIPSYMTTDDRRIQTLQDSEKPRERCLQFGATCLSLRECLALILGSGPPGLGCLGVASNILKRSGFGLSQKEQELAFFNSLESTGVGYLKDCSGLGPAGQAKILAAFEIGRRYAAFRHQSLSPARPLQSLSKLANDALTKIPLSLRLESKEWLGFIAFYRKGHLGELCIIERGVRTHVNFDPADFFARLLALRPQGFFLVHNHPSGSTSPSLQDLELTQRMGDLSGQFGIPLLGHWIVAPQTEQWIKV